MKILLKILFAISALISLIITILFLLALSALMRGGGYVLLPGLGLVVSMGAIVVFLLTVLAGSFVITYLLYRIISEKTLR
ncbi:MAG: hypothetical protein ACR2F2_07960 [Pyrinomonadaceae bacterium]